MKLNSGLKFQNNIFLNFENLLENIEFFLLNIVRIVVGPL